MIIYCCAPILIILNMGTSLGCCPSITDEPNFKEYCKAHSSSSFQHYLAEAINSKEILVTCS